METDSHKVSLAGMRAFNNVEHGGQTKATFLLTLDMLGTKEMLDAVEENV